MNAQPYLERKAKPQLDELIARSIAAVKAMSPAEREAMHAAQRRSWVRAELIFGSDADEARWRAADQAERDRLDAVASARADRLMRERK